jgi:ferritin-like metal-binding protein YciE
MAQGMKLKEPLDLLADQLRDLYSAESQTILTCPELANRATHPRLRRVLADEEKAGLERKQTLRRIAERHGFNLEGDLCRAMQGLIEGGNQHLDMAEDSTVADLLIVAHFNRIKHYSIAGYGFALALADCLDDKDGSAQLLGIVERDRAVIHALARIAGDVFDPCMAKLDR